jgi:hypothetical protein
MMRAKDIRRALGTKVEVFDRRTFISSVLSGLRAVRLTVLKHTIDSVSNAGDLKLTGVRVCWSRTSDNGWGYSLDLTLTPPACQCNIYNGIFTKRMFT